MTSMKFFVYKLHRVCRQNDILKATAVSAFYIWSCKN